MTLTVAELEAAAADCSYKPGWRLLVRELDPHQGPYLSIIVTMADSYRPDQTVPLRIHSPIPPQRDVPAFLEWLLWRLRVIETHEAMEWFKVNGSPYRDPHKGLD